MKNPEDLPRDYPGQFKDMKYKMFPLQYLFIFWSYPVIQLYLLVCLPVLIAFQAYLYDFMLAGTVA